MSKNRWLYFLFVYILLLNFKGCATEDKSIIRLTPKKPGIDRTFKPYITNYKHIIGKSEYSKRLENLSINFSKLEGRTVGICYWLLNDKSEIEIDAEYWKYATTMEREFLIYHELEHCIRYRMHTDGDKPIDDISDFFEKIGHWFGFWKEEKDLEDGCPASIMNSETISQSCQTKHYKYYIEEMASWS